MARERYLHNAGEDTIHSNEIKLVTAKDKRKNWWYYHKFHLLIGIIAAALVGNFIYSIATKVEPDYTIALLTSYSMPQNGVTQLEECIAPYADDRNGDGKVVVQVSNYVFSQDTSDYTNGTRRSYFKQYLTMANDKRQDEIIEEFSVFDEWLDKYEYLIGLSDTCALWRWRGLP